MLLASFVPTFLLMTFHPLKEVRHLLPVLPLVGIVGASLLAHLVAPFRRLRPAVLAALFVWPIYQFVSWSFDTPLAPRADLRLGPIMFSNIDLERESLQWMPTYTYPANSTQWPRQDSLDVMASRLASPGEHARVHVAGTNPYFNALTLMHPARIARLPFTFDPPFTDDYAGADFLITVMANRRYGPVDNRPTAAERALATGEAPFTLVASFPLEEGGKVDVYEADRRVGAARRH
jgi:hypothetical protein